MDTRDRFWIFAAAAVALTSVALSAFIVAFSPEDPYMPTERAALRSDRAVTPPQDRRVNQSAERPASNGLAEGDAGIEEIRDSRSDGRLAYAAGGATAAIAMMFAVIGWLDRGETRRAIDGGCLATESRLVAEMVGSPAVASPGPQDDDTEVSPAVAMIALGFGAFVGRSHAPVPQQLSVATHEGAARLAERAIGLHRLAAGYGAAAFDSSSGANRRRADRRNPLAARAISGVERRSTRRRIIDAACETRSALIKLDRTHPAARLETI